MLIKSMKPGPVQLGCRVLQVNCIIGSECPVNRAKLTLSSVTCGMISTIKLALSTRKKSVLLDLTKTA